LLPYHQQFQHCTSNYHPEYYVLRIFCEVPSSEDYGRRWVDGGELRQRLNRDGIRG
jgi:hypothetical protein